MEKGICCHPVVEKDLVLELDFDKNLMNFLKLLLSSLKFEYLRENMNRVWLQKTEQNKVYRCPIKTGNKCRGVIGCVCETKGIRVLDTDDEERMVQILDRFQ
jgi:hypothetical protein